MDITMKHPKIDTAIRDTLIEKYGFGVNEAEGISVAIDMKDQDMSGYATKGDLKDLEIKLITRIYILHTVTIGTILGVIGRWLGKW